MSGAPLIDWIGVADCLEGRRIKDAIDFSKSYAPDAFLAVGGGSVIDTAKLMNLYTNFPNARFLDFVNAPLGKGLPITKKLYPLIAVPTTAGTGSETTGTAIFDLVAKRAKTGIARTYIRQSIFPSSNQNLSLGTCLELADMIQSSLYPLK